MGNQLKKVIEKDKPEFSRRDFLKFAGTVVVGISGILPNFLLIGEGIAAIPVSQGYLLVDNKKCQGCMTCMLACSLVHEGKESISLSRIQIIQNPFERFPFDLTIAQCRQCVRPACVEACPTGALHARAKYGNVRIVEREKCIGCQSCLEACPYKPSRVMWDFAQKYALKCDLCAEARFWNEKHGPEGKQACVEVCPVMAIKFTKVIPVQKGDTGYKVNLREGSWKKLGYPID